MKSEQLQEILAAHTQWLYGNGGEGADLRSADLRRADLRSANLDFSAWPLWCGSVGAIVDDRIQRQLLYHAYATDNPEQDADIAELFQSELFRRVIAKFHRFDECGGFRHEKLKEEKQ